MSVGENEDVGMAWRFYLGTPKRVTSGGNAIERICMSSVRFLRLGSIGHEML